MTTKAPDSVNKLFHKMTDAELEENRVYWTERAKGSAGPASAGAAERFLRQIESEQVKRTAK